MIQEIDSEYMAPNEYVITWELMLYRLSCMFVCTGRCCYVYQWTLNISLHLSAGRWFCLLCLPLYLFGCLCVSCSIASLFYVVHH